MDSQTIAIVFAVLGPPMTLLVYQWKVISETKRTLNTIELLVHDRAIFKKLLMHLTTDDPQISAKERRTLEKRIERIEDIMQLLASKKNINKLIDAKISAFKKSN